MQSPSQHRKQLHVFRPVFLILISFSLLGAKELAPGETLWRDGVAYRLEGKQLQDAGELQRASAAYRRAVTVYPYYAEAYNDLGVVLESMGDNLRAEEAYKTALRLKPELAAVHTNLALLYEETNRLKEAGEHWAARVRMGPSDDPWVARAVERLKNYNLAIPQTAEEPAVKKTDDVKKSLRAGQAHMEAHRWADAASEFERALVLDPGNKQAARLLRVARAEIEEEKRRTEKELGRSKARVTKEVDLTRRSDAVKQAEIERLIEKSRKEETLKGKEASKELQRQEALKKAEIERLAEKARKGSAKKLKEAQRQEALKKAEAERSQVKVEREVFKAKQAKTPVAKPTVTPKDALAVAQEYARERAQTRKKTNKELFSRATAAMREGNYREAQDQYQQILILDPANREARQGLERAKKALAREESQPGIGP